MYFLDASDEQHECQIKKKIEYHLQLLTKQREIYVNLKKLAENLDAKHDKMLIREIKDLNKWSDGCVHKAENSTE